MQNLGDGPPRNFVEIRYSEIASEAIFGLRVHGLQSIVSNFWLSIYAFSKPADIEFPQKKVVWLAEQQITYTSIQG